MWIFSSIFQHKSSHHLPVSSCWASKGCALRCPSVRSCCVKARVNFLKDQLKQDTIQANLMIMPGSKPSYVVGLKKQKEEHSVYGDIYNSSSWLTLINLPTGLTHNESTSCRIAMFHPKWEYTLLLSCQTHIYKTPWCWKVVLQCEAVQIGAIHLSCSILFLVIWLCLYRPLFTFVFVLQKVVRHNKKHILEKNGRDILVHVFVSNAVLLKCIDDK